MPDAVRNPRPPKAHFSFVRRLGFAAVRAVGAVSPRLALRLAERAFFTPSRHVAPRREHEILAAAARETLDFHGRRVALWRWGTGPVVLLAHGWSGRGGQLGAFVEPLVSCGFSVVAWDAPAHGASEGRRTNLLEFAALLDRLARLAGGAHAVIAHSLGGAAAVLACAQGAPVGRVVVIGAAADPGGFFSWFLRLLGFSDLARFEAMARVERRYGFRWSETDVAARAAGLARVPALVVHDRLDPEVPVADAQRVAAAWPGARLLKTEGLGHRRILRDPGVVATVVRFLVEGTGRTYVTESERVEADLWDRRHRPSRLASA